MMRGAGYCYDPEGRYRCRITAWGSNVSCKVPGGDSKAVARSAASDGDLVNWMLAGFDPVARPRGPGRAKAKAKAKDKAKAKAKAKAKLAT